MKNWVTNALLGMSHAIEAYKKRFTAAFNHTHTHTQREFTYAIYSKLGLALLPGLNDCKVFNVLKAVGGVKVFINMYFLSGEKEMHIIIPYCYSLFKIDTIKLSILIFDE